MARQAIQAGIVAFLIAYVVLGVLIRIAGLNDTSPPLDPTLVPYRTAGLIVNVAGALGIGVLAARRKPGHHRSATPGRCHRCGCNLQGNTSGVCPECGLPTH